MSSVAKRARLSYNYILTTASEQKVKETNCYALRQHNSTNMFDDAAFVFEVTLSVILYLVYFYILILRSRYMHSLSCD